MKTIYKYQIPPKDEFSIDLSEGARVLCLQIQGDQPYIWVLVDTEKSTKPRYFKLAKTGHPLEDSESLSFIGTFQVMSLMDAVFAPSSKTLVFHLFEKLEE